MDDLIRAANGRLKAARAGVTIEQRGNRLSLRATLPAPPGEPVDYRQRRIPLGILASLDGCRHAERLANELAGQLATGRFDWTLWRPEEPPEAAPTVADWLERFRRDYFERRGTEPKVLSTWESEYSRPLRRAGSLDVPLTAAWVRAAILSIPAQEKTR